MSLTRLELKKYKVIACKDKEEVRTYLDTYEDSYRESSKMFKVVVPKSSIAKSKFYTIIVGNPDDQKSWTYYADPRDTTKVQEAILFTDINKISKLTRYVNRKSECLALGLEKQVWISTCIISNGNVVSITDANGKELTV